MVLSNIFRLDGYECLRWTHLAPEARGFKEQLDLLLESFLKLRDSDHLTAWKVGPPKDSGSLTPSLELWHFRLPSTAPDEDAEKLLLAMLPGLEVVASGTWTPKSSQQSVASALAMALTHNIERAFLHLSYRRFKDVFIRVGEDETAIDNGLPACQVDLLASPSALFLQAHVSRRNVRRLRHSDLTCQQDLTVIVSPSGERASVLGSCSSELVARLEQLFIDGGDPKLLVPTRKEARRKKHGYKVRRASEQPFCLHVEVAFEKDPKSDENARLLRTSKRGPSEEDNGGHAQTVPPDKRREGERSDSEPGNTDNSEEPGKITVEHTAIQTQSDRLDRLIFSFDQVLVPSPEVQKRALELRESWIVEESIANGKSDLGGWPSHPTDETAESSDSESGSSKEHEGAEDLLHSDVVSSKKRNEPEERSAEDVPAQKVQKVEGEGFGISASRKTEGDSWWPDDGMEVGLLADFADFGDAFADGDSFGDLPGNSRDGSPGSTSQAPKAPGLQTPSPLGQDSGTKSALSETAASLRQSPKAEESEPFGDLFNELLFRKSSSLSPRSGAFPSLPKSHSTPQETSGGDLDEAGLLLCCPPQFRACDVSLPAQSEESNETGAVRYAPEKKVVEFVRAVLGQSESTAYEALPPATPEPEETPEVQLRGKYSEAEVRRKKKEDPKEEEATVETIESSPHKQGRVEGKRAETREGVEKIGEEKVPSSERNEEAGTGPLFESRPSESALASDLILLQRDARASMRVIGFLESGPEQESGLPALDGVLNELGNREGQESVGEQSQLPAEGAPTNKRDPQKISGDVPGKDEKPKPRPLSPLLLQQAITGTSKYPRPYRIGAAQDSLYAPISAAAAAETLTVEVAEAFGNAFGNENVCGPLTVDQLCDDLEGVSGLLAKPSQPMQVGSPAIEHPVTPPQFSLKSPGGALSAGKTAPQPEILDPPDEESPEPHLGVFKTLAPPPCLVGYQEDWLRIPQGVLKLWEKAPLEPYAAPKRVVYYAFCAQEFVPLCRHFLREVGSVYHVCQLGTHVAASLPSDLATSDAPGIVSLAPATKQKEFVESIRSIVDRLRLPGVNKRNGREDSEEPCTVLYVVLPSLDSEDTGEAVAEIAALFSQFEEAPMEPNVSKVLQVSLAETRLTLKFLSVRDLRRLGTQADALSALKGIAFDVYTMARGTNRKLPSCSGSERALVGSEDFNLQLEKGKETEGKSSSLGPLLFEPAATLASHPPICPVVATGQLEEGEAGEIESGEHAPEAGVPLYCCYAWANEGATLVSVWTDGQGELLDAFVQARDSTAEESSKKEDSSAEFQGAGTSSHKLLEGLLDQCENLLALTGAALMEGEPRLPCHVIISCLGAMPPKESANWASLILARHHDIRQVLPVPGTMPSNPSRRLQDRRSLSVEIERDPLELERFIEQQYSPAIGQQCAFGGGTERAFLSPPDRKSEESRGLLASITLVTLESQDRLQLLFGMEDQGTGRSSLPGPATSARELPHSQNDHLLVPSRALQRLANFSEADQDQLETRSQPVACGYLLSNLEDFETGFITALSEGWPITTRVALMGHFSIEDEGVTRPLLSEREVGVQARHLLESIVEGFQALSWLNARHGGSRTSPLPMHAAMAEQILEILSLD